MRDPMEIKGIGSVRAIDMDNDENAEAVLNGRLMMDGGEMLIELYLRASGEKVFSVSRGDDDFDGLVAMMDLDHVVSLYTIAHDLEEDCECDTCEEAARIREWYQ